LLKSKSEIEVGKSSYGTEQKNADGKKADVNLKL